MSISNWLVFVVCVARATHWHAPQHLTLTYVNLKAGISMEVCVCMLVLWRAIKQQTDKHKLVTHNLGDISKVRVGV